MIDEPERITLTQRRKEMTGASKLQRSKLENISNDSDEEQNSSAKKIVVWVIIIVAVSVAAYLGLKTFLDSSKTKSADDQTAQISPTPTLEEQIVAGTVLPDTDAVNALPIASFSVKDQSVGKESTDNFTITKLWVQSYTTFSRVEFTVTSQGTEKYPLTNIVYDAIAQTLTLTLKNIEKDQSLLTYNNNVVISDSVISEVIHNTVDGINESYTIAVSEAKPFALHVIQNENADTLVVLDIQEIDRSISATTPTTESVITTGTTTVLPTVLLPTATLQPTAAGNTSSTETQFAVGNQSLTSTTTDNSVVLKKRVFNDTVSIFTDKFFLSGGYPNVTATYENKVITVTINNVSVDSIVGNGGSGHRDYKALGVRDVASLDVSNSNHVTKYVYTLSKEIPYRLVFDKNEQTFRIEFKH
ncbi:MAG: hypothetical protein WCJ58_05585 [bacterium]